NGQDDPLRPANEINSSVGPDVARVLARAMSQNREQRFSSAAEMRLPLKGSPEVATLQGKGEAAIVLFSDACKTASAKTVAITEAPTSTGETTVVRSASPRKSKAPWAIGIAAVVLIGIAFGGFYAYQR